MESFYIITMIVASVILVLILTFVGILLNSTKTDLVFPPNANTCPDYYTYDGSYCTINSNINTGSYKTTDSSGNSTSKFSTDTLVAPYTSNDTYFNPSNNSWTSTGLSKICAQKQWANTNNIMWDGVSNYNSC
jgi:hypothetical protein